MYASSLSDEPLQLRKFVKRATVARFADRNRCARADCEGLIDV